MELERRSKLDSDKMTELLFSPRNAEASFSEPIPQLFSMSGNEPILLYIVSMVAVVMVTNDLFTLP